MVRIILHLGGRWLWRCWRAAVLAVNTTLAELLINGTFLRPCIFAEARRIPPFGDHWSSSRNGLTACVSKENGYPSHLTQIAALSQGTASLPLIARHAMFFHSVKKSAWLKSQVLIVSRYLQPMTVYLTAQKFCTNCTVSFCIYTFWVELHNSMNRISMKKHLHLWQFSSQSQGLSFSPVKWRRP